MPRLYKVVSLTFLIFFSALTNASTISLSLNTPGSIQVGDNVSLDLSMDFTSDPTVGGGVNILFGSKLEFVSFTFDPGLGDDPLLRLNPIVSAPGVLNGLGFGNFAGLSGPSVVGTLILKAIAPGLADLALETNVLPAGGFFSLTGAPQTPTLTGTSFNIQPVPLPGAIWLAISGFGLLSLRKKFNRV